MTDRYDARVTRRMMVMGLCTLPFAASARPTRRVVAMDWPIAATMQSLGVTPIAVPAISWYRQIVVTPELPPSVADAGLLNTPSFEFLQRLAPERMIIPPSLVIAAPLLARIAPVTVSRLSTASGAGFPEMEAETRKLGAMLDVEADTFISRVQERLETVRLAISEQPRRRFVIASTVDERHILVQGRGSLFQRVLDRLNCENAAADAIAGPAAIFSLQDVARFRQATLLSISAEGSSVCGNWAGPFRNALPILKDCHTIGSIFATGALPAVERFLAALPAALAAVDGSDG